MPNTKSFTVRKLAASAFNLVIVGMSIAQNWFATINIRNTIVANYKFYKKLETTLRVKVTLSISAKMTKKAASIVNLKRIQIVSSAKMRKKAAADVLVRCRNIYNIRLRSKLQVDPVKVMVTLSATALTKKLRKLSYWDYQTLGTMDSFTLAELDEDLS